MARCEHNWINVRGNYYFCNNCGKEKLIRFPIKDKEGKIIWKNLFKMDLVSIIFLISITALLLTVWTDMTNYRDILKDPIKFCEESNVCEYLESEQENKPFYIPIDNEPSRESISGNIP